MRNSGAEKNMAVLATTYRNEETFEEFMAEILKKGMKIESIPQEKIEKLNYIFPCYNDQPRSDVQIHILSCT